MSLPDSFNYESVPNNYVHCFNHQCINSKECMRYRVAEHCTTLHPIIRIISPACVTDHADTCPYFQPIRKIRMAWGIKHLLDNIPHKDAAELKAQMIAHFGRTSYYRLYRKEYGLLPEQQEFIRGIFRKKGITEEPAFDSYSEEFQWK